MLGYGNLAALTSDPWVGLGGVGGPGGPADAGGGHQQQQDDRRGPGANCAVGYPLTS